MAAASTPGGQFTPQGMEFNRKLGQAIDNTVNEFKSGDTYTKSAMATEGILNIASVFVGGGGAKAAMQAEKVAVVTTQITSKAGAAVKIEQSRKLAFGLSDNLSEFANSIKAETYREFTTGGLQPEQISQAIGNSQNSLHFNLTDMRTLRSLEKGAAGPNYGNVTNWELYTIYNTPGALERTTFYKFIEGTYKVVPKPR